MPKVSAKTTAKVDDFGVAVDRNDELDGYAFSFVTIKEDHSLAPMLSGLREGRCWCPHWGYIFKGKVAFKYADHEEVYEAGDAYYAPPGHIPVVEAGTEGLEFSPAAEYQRTLEVLERNLASLRAS